MAESNVKIKPEISVVMSVRNGESYLSEAIESILNQSFEAFEFIIVNDGSTDNTAKVLRNFANQDLRIKLIELEASGLPVALNTALNYASAPFIARMDADDISLPLRFSKQLEYLKRHEEIAVLGSAAIIINDTGQKRKMKRMPTKPSEVKKALPHKCCIIHPSVMIRRKALQEIGKYSTDYKIAEDYDLWLRISDSSGLANLRQPLIELRRHSKQVTRTNSNNIIMYSVSAVIDHLLRKHDIASDFDNTEKFNVDNIAARLLSLYDLQLSQKDLRTINTNAIRFFRRAALDKVTSTKLDARIVQFSNFRERIKHQLYKSGL